MNNKIKTTLLMSIFIIAIASSACYLLFFNNTPVPISGADNTREESTSGEEPLETVPDINSAGYWIDRLDSPSEIIMTAGEISSLNSAIYNNPGTNTLDLRSIPESLGKEQILDMLDSDYVPGQPYIDGKKADESVFAGLRKNENREALNGAGKINVRFAVICENADMRTFPSHAVMTKTPDASGNVDYFQETKLCIGEAVAVYHTSADGEWLFVQAKNYRGWIRAATAAFCPHGDAMEFAYPQSYIMYTGTSGTFRLGTVLPCMGKDDAGYYALLPSCDSSGNLIKENIYVSAGQSVTTGPLPYTAENVLRQSFKLLGTPYAWGDKGDGLDCSSTIMLVYRCFEIDMPRDVNNQESLPVSKEDFSVLDDNEKREALLNSKPGSLVVLSGHIMLYLGEHDGAPMVLHTTTGDYNKCVVTPAEPYIGRIISVVTIE